MADLARITTRRRGWEDPMKSQRDMVAPTSISMETKDELVSSKTNLAKNSENLLGMEKLQQAAIVYAGPCYTHRRRKDSRTSEDIEVHVWINFLGSCYFRSCRALANSCITIGFFERRAASSYRNCIWKSRNGQPVRITNKKGLHICCRIISAINKDEPRALQQIRNDTVL